MRHGLLDELENHANAKLARVESGEGCLVLLAVELASAVNALEGVGISGRIQVGTATLDIGAPRADMLAGRARPSASEEVSP